MDSLLELKVTRESIATAIDNLSRKYRELPDPDRSKMSEQDVRDYFVTPLLEALGWGVVDPRERSAEKHLPGKGFSDYELCLPIGPNEQDPYMPVVYVEAKKFDSLSDLEVDLFGNAKRTDADVQVIEYAEQFNRKRGESIGWAILTNFQVFRLWDTRRNVLVESVDWFSELKRERTLEVLYLLSRDMVFQDPSFRGLNAYKSLPDIDEKFLAKLNEWRATLASALWKHESNRPKLGSSLEEQRINLRSVVQRTLDRLIVIRTAEDRGLLPVQYRLQEMVKSFGGQNAIPLKLLENIQRNTFSWFDHQYNSKLFGAHLADQMSIQNDPLRGIIEEMCKVSFASMNADILGATYEQYLGQTIDIDEATDSPRLVVNLVTRQEQGSYYTPVKIVQSIVDQTLGKYLFGTSDGLPQSERTSSLRKRITDIQALTVLDPACGSGSFLIYAFDVLNSFYRVERARIEQALEARISELVTSGIPRLAAESQHDPLLLALRTELELTRYARARIIERHLYGVDLDAQAAEVASMNLLLKALTRDERLPRILGDNIKVGNSLVSGVDVDARMDEDSSFQELVDIRQEIHQATILASENAHSREDHEKTIDTLEGRFRAIANRLTSKVNESLVRRGEDGWFERKESVSPFNWQIEFPERFRASDMDQGFTFVIGNPPYVGFHGFQDQKPYLRDTYVSATGKFDLYVPFLERGLRLTSTNGKLSFICPSTFMKRGFGKRLRRFILDNAAIESLHDFAHIQVFRKVLNYTCIVVLERTKATSDHALAYSEGELGAEQRQYLQSKLADEPWVFRFGSDEALVNRLRSSSHFVELGNPSLTSGIAEGIVTGKNSVLLLHQTDISHRALETTFLRKCVRGEDIKRYSVRWGGYYVFYPYELVESKMQVINESRLKRESPNLYKYLGDSKESLATRTYFEGTSKQWYELWCQRNIHDHAVEKIVVPELADSSQFAFVDSEFFYVDTTCGFSVVKGIDPWYVLAVLNSKAGEYLYRRTTVPKANGFLIYKTMFLNPFRVPDPKAIDVSIRQKVSGLAQSVQAQLTKCAVVEATFSEILKSTLPETGESGQHFYRDFYSVASLWDEKRIDTGVSLQSKDPVAGIRIENVVSVERGVMSATDELVISFRSASKGNWQPLIFLKPKTESMRLYLLLAIRKFLLENVRKKVWRLSGRQSSTRTIDIVLQSVVVPIWDSTPGGATRKELITQNVDLILQQLRQKVGMDELNPSLLEAKANAAGLEIDRTVLELYEFSAAERELVESTSTM